MDPERPSFNIADVVIATAGRECGNLFYVIGTDGEYLLLANGKRRKIHHPKRKSVKHLCPVELAGFDHPVIGKLKQGTPVSDRELRQALAAFKEGISLG